MNPKDAHPKALSIHKARIVRYRDNLKSEVEDLVSVEEPLQIVVNGKPSTITMRTPGDDVALALGFLFTEGMIHAYAQIKYAASSDENTVSIITEGTRLPVQTIERNFYSTSSCGVCGKASVDQIAAKSQYLNFGCELRVNYRELMALPDKLREVQEVFEMTGGLHACAIFDASGRYIRHNEDVGRHNALDKLIGYALQDEHLPLAVHVLLLSGRASFELVQKASMAGIQMIVAVGAPSSLAVSLAEKNGITLVGFVKRSGFNIYSRPDRVVWDD
ncbi:MAG: formate dehydrogenase accessory sulfurtransferase FdhD [Bacteroidia bacterium]|nr:formate dehydrogenase accessory sulfurtransferase FdhD [Bacteroidia bacterium]